MNITLVNIGGKTKTLARKFSSMPTARDYVQDGLIAMWDGIENAGWGVHDANATVWNDLSGNGNNLRLLNGAKFDIDSLITADRDRLSVDLGKRMPYDTIELVEREDSSRNSSGLFCFGNSKDDRRFCVLGSYDQFMHPYIMRPNSGSMNKDVIRSHTCSYLGGENVRAFANGEVLTKTDRINSWLIRDGNFGFCGANNYKSWTMVGNVYCVRLYGRALKEDEQMANYAIDKVRFGLE